MYRVVAKASSVGLWELHVEGVGVTQSSSLAATEGMAREYIAAQLGLTDEYGFDVSVATAGRVTDDVPV